MIWKGKDRSPVSLPDKETTFTEIQRVYPNILMDEHGIFNSVVDSFDSAEIKNQYYWGDNLKLLEYLLDNPSIPRPKMIYIDPPYMSEIKYTSIVKGKKTEQPDFERNAFSDQWDNNIDAYLNMLYPRLKLMQQILQKDGNIFVHVDWHVSHYVRVILDEIFGRENFINEIVWCYSGGGNTRKHLQRKHDMIYWYACSSRYTYNQQYRPYSPGTLERGLTAVKGPNYSLSEHGASLQDWWTDINKILSPTAYENVKYPTQKPRELLKRLINMASNPGDLVADFFSGSGTTAEVSSQLGRTWMLCDNSALARQISHNRLINMNQPFSVFADHKIEANSNEINTIISERLEANGSLHYWLNLKIDAYQPAELPDQWEPAQFKSYIDFWEIDPEYDGQIFKSCYQVLRRKKQPNIASNILLSIPKKNNYTMAIKIYDFNAHQTMKVIHFQPDD